MMKIDSIARRILGWKLNRWDRWYDREKGIFIQTSDFQPEQNLDHAMLIVERLEQLGYTYRKLGANDVCFNDIRATGNTLSQAITNAAYSVVLKTSVVDTSTAEYQVC
ncbi:BC1872 family protein [Anaerobacillus sp. MEB173]|uniref:BC1872 family protein n=1 Tax=Anaerobacillus sp. MEB173 TaxID=3383345 RepID=UPI003F92679E